MRIKSLFSIPDGEKVTDKALRRVLISSICSILFCMTCLVSTTWAWFTVSIENRGNVIQIAAVEKTVTITDINNTGNAVVPATDGVFTLKAGKFNVHVNLTNDATPTDDLNKTTKSTAYVLISVVCDNNENEPLYYYFQIVSGEGNAEQMFEIYCTSSAELRFSVDWIMPKATPIGTSPTVPIVIGTKPTDPQTDDSSEESTSEPAETPTEAPTTESTQAPTEESTTPPTTAPSTEPSVPDDTDPATEPPTPSETEPSTDQTQE